MIFFTELSEGHAGSTGGHLGSKKFFKNFKKFTIFFIFFFEKTNKKLFFLDKKTKIENLEIQITNIL